MKPRLPCFFPWARRNATRPSSGRLFCGRVPSPDHPALAAMHQAGGTGGRWRRTAANDGLPRSSLSQSHAQPRIGVSTVMVGPSGGPRSRLGPRGPAFASFSAACVCVRLCVRCEVVAPCKLLATLIASVGPLPGVLPLVTRELVRPREPQRAVLPLASKRSLAGVGPDVRLEMRALGVSFHALVCVGAHKGAGLGVVRAAPLADLGAPGCALLLLRGRARFCFFSFCGVASLSLIFFCSE